MNTQKTFTDLAPELQAKVFKYMPKGLELSLVSNDFAQGWKQGLEHVEILTVPVTLLERSTFPRLKSAKFSLDSLSNLPRDERKNLLDSYITKLSTIPSLRHITISHTRDAVSLLQILQAFKTNKRIEAVTIEGVAFESALIARRAKAIFEVLAQMSLKVLTLRRCRLSFLPDLFTVSNNTPLAASLTHFNLDKNLILSAPFTALYSLPKLETLSLRDNKLRSIEGLGHFPSLIHLDISANLLQRLPETLVALTKLRSLIIKNNKLREMPSRILSQLQSLVSLSADNNPCVLVLESHTFQDLPLRHLSLNASPAPQIEAAPMPSSTSTSSVADETVVSVEVVQEPISAAFLASIPSGLETLCMQHHQVNLIPSGFFDNQAASLARFDLSSNALTSIPTDFAKLSNLDVLSLANNNLSQIINGLDNLPASLQSLNLSSNPLAIMPSSISRFSNLTTLALSDANLTDLPSTICELTRLRTLDLADNCLSSLPEALSALSSSSCKVSLCDEDKHEHLTTYAPKPKPVTRLSSSKTSGASTCDVTSPRGTRSVPGFVVFSDSQWNKLKSLLAKGSGKEDLPDLLLCDSSLTPTSPSVSC